MQEKPGSEKVSIENLGKQLFERNPQNKKSQNGKSECPQFENRKNIRSANDE